MENIQITDIILKELNKPASLKKYVKDRPGHDRRYSLDISKIKKLGWKPRHTFDAAIKETIKWYRENEAWWRDIKEGKREFKDFKDRWYKER